MHRAQVFAFNESPSHKEGKSTTLTMCGVEDSSSLNESPSHKEGKLRRLSGSVQGVNSLNESPSHKEGK